MRLFRIPDLTIKHVILDHHLLNNLQTKYEIVDLVSGIMNDRFLIKMEMELGIKK